MSGATVSTRSPLKRIAVVLGACLVAIASYGVARPDSSRPEPIAADSSWDEPEVDSPLQAPQIVAVSNTSDAGMSSPLAESVLRPTNGYRETNSQSQTHVWAGASGDDPSTGLIFQISANVETGETTGGTVALTGTGAITLVSFSGTTLSFTTAAGQTGEYSLLTRSARITGCVGDPPAENEALSAC